MKKNMLSVRRFRGLGNVILMAPVLLKAAKERPTELVTRIEWVEALRDLVPQISFTTVARPSTIDLDVITLTHAEQFTRHRTDWFASLLNVTGPIPRLRLGVESVPPLKLPCDDYILLAPDASHPSRTWPIEYVQRFCAIAAEKAVVVVGDRTHNLPPATVDLRNRISTRELLAVVAHADAIVTMDSACLHIAEAFRKTVVALFGGMDFRFRSSSPTTTNALHGNVACYPCNKQEVCSGRYDCLHCLTPDFVLSSVTQLR